MSIKVISDLDSYGNPGWQIRVVVFVPASERWRFEGKMQLVRDRWVSRNEYPCNQDAKNLGAQWETEFYDSVNRRGNQVLFADCLDIVINGDSDRVGRQIAGNVKAQLGHLPVNASLKEELLDWAAWERMRKGLVRKKENGVWGFFPGTETISESYVRGHLRIAKTAINKMIEQHPALLQLNPLAKLKIGRNLARRRPVEADEMHKLNEVIGNDYLWLLFPWEFAKMNMIRPQDQFTLSQTKHCTRDNNQWRIEYEPQKTIDQVLEKVYARPVVFDELEPWFLKLHSPKECDNVFTRPGFPRFGEDSGRIYPLSHSTVANVWSTILKKAGIVDLIWYDWRHHAVGFLLDHGFSEVEIMDIAGWTTPTMIWHYYPRGKGKDLRSKEKMRLWNAQDAQNRGLGADLKAA